ncbi:MFS transporter [Amycolatopsis nigrescens]|uniref:MFS transporter n=1 Tax=Amycolatopsis nigrescens TaxID=381445 RepID=UPI00058BD752|nr:MFS transporter [Amycolatopsis nigrescens]
MSPLRDRHFRLLLLATVAVFSGFALLLSVVPLWVVRQGAGELAAGGATGGFMATTVAAQLIVPKLVDRLGYGHVTGFGALFLAVPAPLLIVATDWPAIWAVSLVRGIGFGLVTVCGAALVAELLPRETLARGSGLYGAAVGLPQLVGLPAGTWMAEHWGFTPVFLIAAALPLAGLLPIAGLPAVCPAKPHGAHWLSTVDATWRPWLVLLSGAVGFGSLVTFLPIVLTGSPGVASAALFAAAAGALVSRWAAGLLGDRLAGTGRMLPIALLLTAAGLAGVAATVSGGGSGWVLAAVTVFGLGFGVLQNDSLVAMFARAPTGPASVVWNVAYDAGTGLGAVVVGAIVAGAGYPIAFGVLAALAVVLLPAAISVSRSG